MKKSKLLIQIITDSIDYNTLEIKEYQLFIATIFSYYLSAINVGKTKKILIELLGEKEILYCIPEEKNETLYTIKKSFDFTKFNSSSDHSKKKMLLETVKDSLVFLFEKWRWNCDEIRVAYNKVIESDFQSRFVLEQSKWNRDRQVVAVVIAEHFLKEALISVEFLSKEQHLLRRVDLFRTLPSPFFYSQILGSTKWLTQTEFQISNKTKEYSINISLEGESSIVYSPKQRDIDGVKNEIKSITTQQIIRL